MVKRQSLLIAFVIIAIFAVVGYRYDQYVFKKNYVVNAAAPCDAAMNSCFAADCSPEEDASCDTTPYEKVTLPAADAPDCLLENSCSQFDCSNANQCTITYCTPDTAEDGEVCTNGSGSGNANE